MGNNVLPSTVRQKCEENVCTRWASKGKPFPSCPSDSSVSTVCPPCPTTTSDTTALASIMSWKVLVRLQDKPVNSEAQTFPFFPTCLCQLFVWEQPLEKLLLREKRKGGCRGHFKQEENQGGEPHKDCKEKIKLKPPQKLSPSGPPNNLLYQRFIVNQLAKAAGVCRKGGSSRDNGLPCCITI